MPDLGLGLTITKPHLSGGATPEFSNVYSALLDGTDDAVETTYSPTVGSTAFTATMWIKTSNTTTNQGFVSNLSSSSVHNLAVISPSSTKSFFVIINNGSGQSLINGIGGNDSTLDIRDGNWHHLAITVNGPYVKIYKDGGDAAINASNPTNTQGTPFGTWTSPTSYIGKSQNFWFGTNGSLHYNNGNRYYLDGNIDEAAVWESELSGSEISAIYNSGLPADISSYSPVGWWRMGDNDLGLGTTITDQGSGGNNATLDNGASFSTDVPSASQPFTNLRSVSFDGTNEYMGSLPINRLNGASWSTSTPVSQSAWVKSNSFSVDDAVFGIGQYTIEGLFNASKAGGNSGIHQLASGYYLWLSGTQHNLTGTFSTGVWYHIAWTWDGTNGVIYVNGVQNRTFTDNSNGYAVRFSIWAGGGGRWNAYSNSLVDELATWDSALTSADITTIYNNGVPGDISSYSPLVWYRMGDGTEAGSGTDIYDMSGNSSANAILRNGPTFSTDVPLASQPYNNSNSLLLDGTDDNASLSDTGIGVDSQSAYTFSCWAKFDTVTHNSGIFTVDGGTVINDWTFNNWWRITGSGNVLSWYHSISGTSYKIVSGSLTGAGLSAFATGTWYHIMCTWSGSELKSYVNGTLIATLTGVTEWRGRPGRNFAINVGRNRIAYIDGKIDEWAWIPTDQSSAVADIYNSGVPSDLSSLSPLFYYRMGENDQGTGTTVTNMGSGTGNLTLNNGATFSTDVPT